LRRPPIRSVSLISYGSTKLIPFPNIGGKEFQQFFETLPNAITETSRVVIFYLSQLNLGKQHQDYLKITQETLEREFELYSGTIFAAQQGDIVCIYESDDNTFIKPLAEKIRTFFSEDVLTGSPLSNEFYTEYLLSKNYKSFYKAIQEIIEAQKNYLMPRGTEKWIRHSRRHVTPLSPTKFKEIADKLSKTNISKCIRSQSICKLTKKEPEIVSKEIYVQIADLQREICPNVDLLTDPLLFQSLTHYLDMAVLKELSNSRSKHTTSHLNLNLNITTLLSDAFLSWDKKRTEKERQSIIIELQKMDIFMDIGAYKFIRNLLSLKGYKICLDGMTHLTLPLIDWEKLNVDYNKLYWSMELLSETAFLETLKKADSKIILAHCDDPQALIWGKKQGIKLFQGWHVDQLLMPGYTEENTA